MTGSAAALVRRYGVLPIFFRLFENLRYTLFCFLFAVGVVVVAAVLCCSINLFNLFFWVGVGVGSWSGNNKINHDVYMIKIIECSADKEYK